MMLDTNWHNNDLFKTRLFCPAQCKNLKSMKRISKLLTMAIISGLFLNSCSSDDDIIDPEEPQPEEGAYTDGFFVLNEGSQTAGTVTYISDDLQTSEQNIYESVNEGEDLGKFVQSIFFEDDLAYIISNGSNLITIVDRYTFELVGKVDSGLQSPRYGVIENGKIYVTNQGSYEDPGATEFDDFIAIIDLETLEVEKTIETNTVLEYIQEEDGLIYVQKAAFGSGNEIAVIDSTTDEIIETIETEENLSSFEIEDGILYALSSSVLEKINLASGEVIEIAITSEDGSPANLNLEDGMIYYTIKNSVYGMDENAETAPAEALFSYDSNSLYGLAYGFEVEDDRIYIADGGDFASNSFVEIYTTSGELLENIDVGVGPNGFYFND
jgi:DNA-binding beta-propeller fold protein YncE